MVSTAGHPTDASSRAPPMGSPKVDTIRARLKVVGPGPATMFADACRLIENPGYLGTTSHVVAHLLREILSSLEEVLYAVAAPSKIEAPSTPALTERADEDGCEKRISHATKVKGILEMLEVDPRSHVGGKWVEIAQA